MARLETNGGSAGDAPQPRRNAAAQSDGSARASTPLISNICSRPMRPIPPRSARHGATISRASARSASRATSPRTVLGAAGLAACSRPTSWSLRSAAAEPAKARARQGRAPAERPRPRPRRLQRAARDSVRALMMIRAYRMRGHLHANLDPLGLEQRQRPLANCIPSTYGFTDEDYDRKIFIDGVMGMKYASVFEMVAILRRTYCGPIGYEFMHISNPEEKAWIQARIEGPKKEIAFTAEGKKAILRKLVEAEGFEKFLDVKYTGTKRFGLDGSEVDRAGAGADHQARRRAGREGDRARHGASRPAQRSLPGDGQAASRSVPRIQGRLLPAGRGRGLGRREISSRRLVRSRVRRQQGASVADRQSVASRDRRSGRARQGARQAGSISLRRQ